MHIPIEFSQIKLPEKASHKGQNGRLLIIGGSHLFHSASLWSLKVASRIVDLVHYASVAENNQLVMELKKEFRDGIVISRSDIESYIEEDDCILIGPGMTRDTETKELTDRLLKKYPHKQWVIDAGALQMMDTALIPKNAILTPHSLEFSNLYARSSGEIPNPTFDKLSASKSQIPNNFQNQNIKTEIVSFAKKHQCMLLVKGEVDIVSDGQKVQEISGGNAGMTKGGTGDVLAGLIAALACKSDPWIATVAGSSINKQAGDSLYKKVGMFFNASDLADEIPRVMKKIFTK